MKEWNMFGELYTLLKKCTMEHMNQKQLWALCVEFGQKYSDEGDFDSLSYQLACNLYSYSLLDNRTSPFTFGNDSEEKKMFTAFYKICQKYWTRQAETEEIYWNNCIKEFILILNKLLCYKNFCKLFLLLHLSLHHVLVFCICSDIHSIHRLIQSASTRIWLNLFDCKEECIL